ncbi:hypothetical protein GCM10010974_21660 [Brevibacterium sediminis]|uniref:Uncharacterized protein n=1 Tax=Brevibacterium sediminis TaxID=1857024 RepID=A0A5C4X5T0_9MICO|nr:hypothetical protein [Brevibacterium sediminis]TNM56649.1 hypothetical protein FHQ09_03395 [Brevibacterium sediminis]GGC38868.1 hypothetical protein GCM10010974_21660 [Brevibacterium sediminis]
MNTHPAEREGAGIDSWIVVDLDRISRLPERLRRLWPPDLLPRRVDRDSRAASAEEEISGAASGAAVAGSRTAAATSGMGEGSGGAKRDLDVLTAWLRGFASELNRVRTRISVVVSSGVETVHLALCLGPGIAHAILALQGEGLEDFARHQLLRRIEPGRIGHVVEDLTELVNQDCVLTLSWASGRGATGLEFLRREGGTWFRPVIERAGDSVTVDDDVDAGESAVRKLLSAVLTRTLTAGAPS